MEPVLARSGWRNVGMDRAVSERPLPING